MFPFSLCASLLFLCKLKLIKLELASENVPSVALSGKKLLLLEIADLTSKQQEARFPFIFDEVVS